MVEIADDPSDRVEQVQEVVSDGSYQDKVSVLSALPDAPSAEGGEDEVTSKLEDWLDENANGELDTDLEVVGGGEPEPDGGDAPEVEVETADEYEDKQREAEERTAHVRQIKKQERELFFDLAEELWHVADRDLYHYVENPQTGQPYDAMGRYVEEETVHSKRMGQYLRQIWDYYVVEHSREFLLQVQHIGWTKLQELIDVITPENADRWIEYCENHSVSDLQDELKQLEGDDEGVGDEEGPEGETARTERVTFELKEEEVETAKAAVDIAKDLADTDNKSEAFMAICTQYVSAFQDLPQKPNALEEAIARFERNFDVTLVGFKDGKAVYNREFLEALAEKAKGGGDGDAEEQAENDGEEG